MRKSLGDKRNEISPAQIEEISKLHDDFKENEFVKIFDNEALGYRKITVERPLRLNFQASSERISRLKEQSAFQNLAISKKKKDLQEKAREEAEGRKVQEEIINALCGMDGNILYKDRAQFEKALNAALKKADLKPAAAVKKAIFEALSERDETAEICKDKDGNKEADSQLRDTENVPLKEDIYTYFEREVLPHVPDAWIDETPATQKTARSEKSGTKSTSTATSTNMSLREHLKRSRLILISWRTKFWKC